MPTVVIVGGGFGGLEAAKGLRRAKAQVILVDRSNHHLFQPLLYQVATAGLSPADIAVPIRSVLRKQKNAQVFMDEVTGIDTAQRRVHLKGRPDLQYDYLVLATGARHGYFGRPEWEHLAPGIKTIQEAVSIRSKILSAFEVAERSEDEKEIRRWLNFVIVGGGATGVEMAGAIAELAKRAMVRDFRTIKSEDAQIILVEASERILQAFPAELSLRAERDLGRLGVDVRTRTLVESVDKDGVDTNAGRIDSKTVIWAAGVEASAAARWLGAESDPQGRVIVEKDMSVPGMESVFVVGDSAHYEEDGAPLPGLAPVAMQQGRFVGRAILAKLEGRPPPRPFRYVDKGSLATIGRGRAVALIKGLRFAGKAAWIVWAFVHIMYLIGFKNKALVMFQWMWAYWTWQRGARLITDCPPESETS